MQKQPARNGPAENPAETQPPSAEATAKVRAVLFDADGADQQLSIDAIDSSRLSERQLLWVDVERSEGDDLQTVLQALGLESFEPMLVEGGDVRPRLQNFGDWFLVRAVVITHAGKLKFVAQMLSLVVGRNVVLTLHREPLDYLKQLGERERADTQLGMLSAESFVVSLLDWQLTTYFDAVADLEAAIDRLEVHLLGQRVNGNSVPALAQLRRAASRLRRLLVPHRVVFSAMARPDFRPEKDGEAAQFRGLQERFERCLDMVENARDLVIGSFELFATRTAQQTNETMRALTFFTVLLGTLAVLAGVLGMNFEADIFRSGGRGFVVTIGSMVLIVAAALMVARWRHWL